MEEISHSDICGITTKGACRLTILDDSLCFYMICHERHVPMEIFACVMRAFAYRGLTSRQIMRMILSCTLLFQGKACGERQRSGNSGGFA